MELKTKSKRFRFIYLALIKPFTDLTTHSHGLSLPAFAHQPKNVQERIRILWKKIS